MIMQTPNNKFYAKALFKAVVLALVITTVIATMIDRFAGSAQIVTGYIIEKKSEAAISATLERKAPKNGTQNDFLLVVFSNGSSTAVECDREYFYAATLGQEVKYISQKGYLTDWYWTKELIY